MYVSTAYVLRAFLLECQVFKHPLTVNWEQSISLLANIELKFTVLELRYLHFTNLYAKISLQKVL